jgi:hypothetical protein
VIPNIHQTIYAAASNPKALDMSTWHTCDNTHCWAGWVVTLAGAEGKKLESFFDTPLAAMKILDASSPLQVSPVRFFEGNADALREMKRMAELEAGRLMPKIITSHVFPPIPDRSNDWAAWYDSFGEEGPIGRGATELEAIADLTENYDAPEEIAAPAVLKTGRAL